MASNTKFVIILLILTISTHIVLSDKSNIVYRLPNNTVPEHYQIEITTKLEKDDFKFSGICTITIKVLVETYEIVLHSKLADIQKTELVSSDNIKIITYKQINDKNEFLTIISDQKLIKGKLYYLKIFYSSKLRTDKLGFYLSSYTNHLGSKVWLAATQFAPTEARHAFPCYDEPNRKATFQIEITHPSELKAISGTEPLEMKRNMNGVSTTKFQKTKIMSTYLVGFVISDFKKTLSRTPNVLHELYATPKSILIANNSAALASMLMSVLADHFTEKFPQSLMKHVALPDFHFSGMENWGIVTYKESSFLYDPDKHSVDMKVAAISLIGHEMSHSWFGNLVTMEWWTYVWLKEGFSTLYAYYGALKSNRKDMSPSVVLFIILAICMDTAFSYKNVDYRLPNNTAPEHYYIQITTKLEKDDFQFSGICTIGINVLMETKVIVLHSKLADIERIELLSSNGYNITITNNDVNYINRFLTISLNEKLIKGELYYLKIWYSSKLRTDKLGFYLSSYTNHLGSKVWLAATQFAPTEARHAFPCYDEPNRKATFQMEITHPSELKAISGTESLGTKTNMDGTSTTKFQKTELMPTYLVGFVISDFEKIIKRTYEPEMLHEVYVRPNKISMPQHSMNFASRLFDTLAECFEEKLPQRVMKNVAIPDFVLSGMENWGIVVYKERKFLYNPTKHSADHQVVAVTLISHEMAHSWFGNLVTMEWWTYVWLKEGFSMLYAYYGPQKVCKQID